MKKQVFIKESHINAPVETVFKWHAMPGALERLSPPWDPLQVIEKQGRIHTGARTVLKMKAGPIPFIWGAEHTDYEENRLFRDIQVKGPFAQWVHTHAFEPDGPHACFLKDHIEYALRFSPLGDFFARDMVHKKLEHIFTYRHATTAADIAAHLRYKDMRRLNVLISGASGVVGSALLPFLTTGGHRVVSLVRRTPSSQTPPEKKSEKKEVFWNPARGELNSDELGNINAVVHLAGENIGQGRWTTEKKKSIIDSRIKGTELLARTVADIDPLPDVMICASAIGYYGHRKHWTMTEKDGPGNDFISEVCYEWEKAAAPAVEKGIRVVFMRIGIALTPAGGALGKLLLPFRLGLGGKISNGCQFMSWVSIDDVIGAIYHAVYNDTLEGPVNLVSPHPVTNLEFTHTLANVLSRKAPFTSPAAAVKLGFGEMGREILLSSTRVSPEKLLKTGYLFQHPTLEEALAHVLGKK